MTLRRMCRSSFFSIALNECVFAEVFLKIKQSRVLLSFSLRRNVQGEGSLLSCCFEGDMLVLDVGDFGVYVKFFPNSDDVCCVCGVCLENRLCACVSICGDDGAKQSIGFSRAGRSPTEWTEQVIVNDGAVELGALKVR